MGGASSVEGLGVDSLPSNLLHSKVSKLNSNATQTQKEFSDIDLFCLILSKCNITVFKHNQMSKCA